LSDIVDQIGLKVGDLAALRPIDVADGDVWLTLFLVLVLRTFFAAEIKQWTLIEKKAVTWLNKNGFDINKQQHLLPAVNALLK
jgi:hypothetical protein